MFHLPLVLAVKAAIGALAVLVVIAILTYQQVVTWFVERTAIKRAKQSNVAFTLVEKLQNGDYKTVQGVFDTQTATLVDGKAWESRSIDQDLAEIHSTEELAIYN